MDAGNPQKLSRLRAKRINRNRTVAETLDENRSLLRVQHHARPELDEKEPRPDTNRTDYKQMFRSHLTSVE